MSSEMEMTSGGFVRGDAAAAEGVLGLSLGFQDPVDDDLGAVHLVRDNRPAPAGLEGVVQATDVVDCLDEAQVLPKGALAGLDEFLGKRFL